MRIALIFITIFMGLNIYADEEDIFADIDLGRMEVDADFVDDFALIENTPLSAQARVMSHHPYDPYSLYFCQRDERSLSALLSQETLARVFYMTLFPQAHIKLWHIHGHLGLPLRFPLFDNTNATEQQGLRRRGFVDVEDLISPRGGDFRTFADAFKIIRQLEIGSLEHDYYFAVQRHQALTLGQGDMMREMQSDYLYDQDYLFARGHVNFQPVRIDAVSGPIPKITMLGLNAKIQPLTSLMVPLVQNISFDLSYVADYQALGAPMREEEAYLLDAERRLLKRDHGTAQGVSVGIASSYEPLAWLNLKPYLSWGQLWLTGLKASDQQGSGRYGHGFAAGHDASFYFMPSQRDSSLFFRSEARLFSRNYIPNYFGYNYMLDRVSFFEDSGVSKYLFTANFSDKNWHFGHMFEVGYAYNKIFNVKLAYENARIIKNNISLVPLRKVRFSTGLALFERLKIQARYEAQAIHNLKDTFSFMKSRGLLALHGQAKIASFLYFDSWLKHGFGINNMYQANKSHAWLSRRPETRSLNFGIGLELAMAL